MFGLFRGKEAPCIGLSRVAVECSIELRDAFQGSIPQSAGFFTSTIPFFVLAHNFVFFTVGNRYGTKALGDIEKAARGSASVISEVLSSNTKGAVPREKIAQLFITELESQRERTFSCLEKSGTDPDSAIRGVCIMLLNQIGIAGPDANVLANAIELTSGCFSSAIESLRAEYKP
jgi:hypothetical protein